MTSLKVIALISGGKDSLFSILHCLANGHTIVALANLHPSASSNGDEDINSYMYQTVGHSIIPLYEEALSIPLYREEICGSAVNSSREYAQQAQDETESLVPLLKKAMAAHPEANAVSTGAIFSTYQRTRVENVAVRLGLTPLSYLWQYPILPPYTQSSLLSDMHTMGQDARIIKVSSGGLDESFLWENVADSKTITRMKKAIGRFSGDADGALLGEGGEFETLAINGPELLWKKSIEVDVDGVVQQSGGTAIWKGKSGRVVEKTTQEDSVVRLENLRRPPVLDDEFLKLLDLELGSGTTIIELPESSMMNTPVLLNKHHKRGNSFIASNLTGEVAPGLASEAKIQLTNILLRLDSTLSLYNIRKEHISHCTLLVRDMAAFAEVNSIYAQYSSYTNPPSRVTVAIGAEMPSPYDVMLSVFAEQGVERKGLHVQSQSYWAPANIGPYSQAISTALLPSTTRSSAEWEDAGYEVKIAGQIPLHPPSMTLYSDHGFKGQAILSLQHLWRIGREQGVKWWTAGVAVLPFLLDRKEQNKRIALTQDLWKTVHTRDDEEAEAEEMDAWDLKNLHPTFTDTITRAPIPDYASIQRPDDSERRDNPPCFVAEVESLPRYASIEWCCSGLTSSKISHRDLHSNTTNMSLTEVASRTSRTSYYAVEIADLEQDLEAVRKLARWNYATLYASRGFDRGDWDMKGVSWIPCKKVWGDGGREVRAVLVGRIDDEVGPPEEEDSE